MVIDIIIGQKYSLRVMMKHLPTSGACIFIKFPLARFCLMLHGDNYWGKEKIFLEVKEG